MPLISVILPVYNGAAFLGEAIDNILQQTVTDFELLILNDGSTDGSEQIIKSYTDKRIVYKKNETNRGLIFTLNEGIKLSSGTYIARMDADDISLPERLEKQLAYLQQHKLHICATRVALINAAGESIPHWKDDWNTIAPAAIRSFLIKDNCIAHPSVVGDATLFKKYRYREAQKYSEDYDLWLRLVADGIRFGKHEAPLLYYRVVPTSATRFKKINIFLRLAKVKTKFALYCFAKGKFSGYTITVFLYAGVDLIKALGKELKALFTK